jgi:hypothetical protein
VFSDPRHVRTIVNALTADHVEAYAHDPLFRAAVTDLAQMLPAMVAGLAAEAAKRDAAAVQGLAGLDPGDPPPLALLPAPPPDPDTHFPWCYLFDHPYSTAVACACRPEDRP